MSNEITVDNVYKSFDEKQVLKGVSFEVQKGEIFGLLGPSGAGKTTLLNLITGQLGFDSGYISVLNHDVTTIHSSIYQYMGMLMDDQGLYMRLTCFQNLKIMALIHRLNNVDILEALDKVNLIEEKDTPVVKMSKGMCQRLAFAKAIINKPKVLFLDEPTTGLDPVTTNYIHSMIQELAHEGTTIILTTHNMDEATKLCDNVGLLSDGVLVEYGSPAELCYKYREEDLFRISTKDDKEMLVKNTSSGRKDIVDLLLKNEIKTIHTEETNLQKIFILLTGEDLNNEDSKH